MKSDLNFVRRSQHVLRMVSELHRMGYQRLRAMPFEYPLAYRVFIGPASVFHPENGAYCDQSTTDDDCSIEYSSAQENKYFEWGDATNDNARKLANKFLARYPRVCERARGRDWAYAGWLAELVGVLEQGSLLPVLFSEYSEPALTLTELPLKDYARGEIEQWFPLPPTV